MGWVTAATAQNLTGTYTADGDVTYLGPAESSGGCLDMTHLRYIGCRRMMLGPFGDKTK